MENLEKSDKELSSILNGNKKEIVVKNELVVFLNDVEEFVGLKGEKMGPYYKGQVSNIPKEIAAILIGDGRAEIV